MKKIGISKGCKAFFVLMVFIQICLVGTYSISALENGLARTPPMGWNSWNFFGGNITDAIVRQIADAMASNGMKAAGYVYINIDDTWQVSRDSSNTIVADSSKFPNGMKSLADYVHSKGLKLGLYSDRGTSTCAGKPGSHGYETKDANTYASWGIDYLKYDNCNGDNDMQADYERMRDALLACGYPVCYSLCAWQFYSWEPDCGNLWRTTGDIQATWTSITSNIDTNSSLAQYAGPGRWNDPDMLEVGNGSLTEAESRAHFSMWCIMAAPLIAGNDLRNMSQATTNILTNTEAIAVDQDAAGIQGTRVVDNGDLEVWCKPLGAANGGPKAVVLLNRSGSTASMTVNWSDIGLSGSASVRDLWAKTDLGSFSGSYSASVPSHDATMVLIGGSPGTPWPTDPPTPVPTVGPTPGPGECSCKAGCGSRTTISAEFTKDGPGELCWESTCLGDSINSWNMTTLEVNGVDCTNKFVAISSISSPDGKYYVYYKGDYSYSHCEIKGACTGTITPAPTTEPVQTVAPTTEPAQTVAPTIEITPEPTSVTGILGDVNSDGSIDIVDALLVAQYYVGTNPSNFNAANADVNKDGSVDIVDALRIAQYYVGLISGF
jgi:alpha-galactosidase